MHRHHRDERKAAEDSKKTNQAKKKGVQPWLSKSSRDKKKKREREKIRDRQPQQSNEEKGGISGAKKLAGKWGNQISVLYPGG